jgi:tetratricopeptide (TPR) repeat protein
MMFDMAKWKKAEQALMEAFDKGMNDKHNGEAWLLLGMTRFKLSQFDKAIEACEKASKFKNSAKHAKQWITYIANEKLKYESMQPTSS